MTCPTRDLENLTLPGVLPVRRQIGARTLILSPMVVGTWAGCQTRPCTDFKATRKILSAYKCIVASGLSKENLISLSTFKYVYYIEIEGNKCDYWKMDTFFCLQSYCSGAEYDTPDKGYA